MATERSDNAAGGLLATVFADTVDLECVATGLVVVFAANLLLEFIDFRREEFDRTSAVGADHVMVAATVVLMLVSGNAVVKGDFAGKPTLRQKFESAVNSGESDLWIFLLYQTMELVCGHVVAGLEKRLQDGVALLGMLQPDALQMTMQDLLRFAH